jgi:protein ImuB
VIQAMARGEDAGPLVPLLPDERFESTLELEWPIEGLEPLSFVLSRLADPVCSHLDRRGRAAAVLHVELRLVTRETWTRRLDLPAPIKDPRVLRTLALLDLESNPPPAGIDVVTLRVEPTPARTLQHSLLERARPAPEQVSTLVARLSALMGDSRVGSPVLVDNHRPGAFQMTRFTGDGHLETAVEDTPGSASGPAFRRFRHPIVAEVSVDDGRPHRVHVTRPGVTGGAVTVGAGPWRTSGDWWGNEVWDHDEWDVDLDSGVVCRLLRDRRKNRWYVEGVYD